MSALAMRAVTQHDLLDIILDAMPLQDAEAVKRVAVDLRRELRDHSAAEKVVLLAYGGGKDSSYVTAFIRAVQLYSDRELGSGFRLRVATNRHSGMPAAVMANIERTYGALGMHDDPAVELLVIDGNDVSAFAVDLPFPAALIERNRSDILMNGHRFAGEARPTFCNACNLSMVNSFGVAATWDGGADVIITGDSHKEQKAYLVWTRKLAREFGAEDGRSSGGLGGFLRTMDGIGRSYHGEIHGGRAGGSIVHALPKAPRFFSIYGYIAYEAGAHWDFLIRFLEFEFDELAFSFTESDCANPLLMSHFRGLRSERVQGRSYADGVREYLDYALKLMVRKDFPPVLIDIMAARYRDADAVSHMRDRASGFARTSLDLTESQIVCMLSAPFGDKGRNLYRWLAKEAPRLLQQEQSIRDMLDENERWIDRPELADLLAELSGLTLDQMRQCWNSPVVPNLADPKAVGTAIGRILKDDPHKATIVTRHAPGGPDVVEIISGR